MNTRRHLSLVPDLPGTPAPAGPAAALPRRPRKPRPAGGRAAAVAALAAGLTLGLMAGGASTLATHPGEFAAVLIPLAGAVGLTIAAAFRSRAVAQRRRRAAAQRQRSANGRRMLRPRPVLVHSRDEFRPVLIATEPVAQPVRRAA